MYIFVYPTNILHSFTYQFIVLPTNVIISCTKLKIHSAFNIFIQIVLFSQLFRLIDPIFVIVNASACFRFCLRYVSVAGVQAAFAVVLGTSAWGMEEQRIAIKHQLLNTKTILMAPLFIARRINELHLSMRYIALFPCR